MNVKEMDELLERGQYVVDHLGVLEKDSIGETIKVFRADGLMVTFDRLSPKNDKMALAGVTGILEVYINGDAVVKSWRPAYHTSWRHLDYGPRALYLLRQLMVLDDLSNAVDV